MLTSRSPVYPGNRRKGEQAWYLRHFATTESLFIGYTLENGPSMIPTRNKAIINLYRVLLTLMEGIPVVTRERLRDACILELYLGRIVGFSFS